MKLFSLSSLFFVLLATVGVLFNSTLATSPIDLGDAATYAILAGSTITSTSAIGTVVSGNMGVFPGTSILGFPPAILNGAMNAANPAALNAQASLTVAYNTAAGKAANVTLSNTDLGGLTLLPGVYKFDAAAAMNGMLTLDAAGNPNAVWVFQIGSAFLAALGSSVVFKNSIGNPEYVYWQVGSSATLNTGASLQGTVKSMDIFGILCVD